MDERQVTLGIQVTVGPDGDDEEVDQAASRLRQELLDLDVDGVEAPGEEEPPPGTRAANLATVGALVVNLADPQLLGAVVAAIRSWLAGSPRRSIKLQLGDDALELTGISAQEQRRLADEWLARNAR